MRIVSEAWANLLQKLGVQPKYRFEIVSYSVENSPTFPYYLQTRFTAVCHKTGKHFAGYVLPGVVPRKELLTDLNLGRMH